MIPVTHPDTLIDSLAVNLECNDRVIAEVPSGTSKRLFKSYATSRLLHSITPKR